MKVKFKLKKFELRDMIAAIAMTRKTVKLNERLELEALELGRKLFRKLEDSERWPEDKELAIKVDHFYIDLLHEVEKTCGLYSDVYHAMLIKYYVDQIQKEINESRFNATAKRLPAGE